MKRRRPLGTGLHGLETFDRGANALSLAAAMLAITLVLAGGCSRARRPELPQTFPVSGKVLLDGKPLAGATVMFNPEGGSGHGSIALTDAQGVYKLMTFVPGDGVVPGNYKVAITKIELGTSSSDSPAAVAPDPKNILPAKYADDTTSELRATVEAKPDNAFDFTLSR